MSACVRNCCKAASVALTRLVGLFEPKLLVRMLLNAGRFAHGADRAAGDHAGAGGGRDQHHLGGAEGAFDAMRDGSAFRASISNMLREPSLTAFSTLGGTSLALP